MKKILFSSLATLVLFSSTFILHRNNVSASYVPSEYQRGIWYNKTTQMYYTVTKHHVYTDHNGNSTAYKFRGKGMNWNGMKWHDAYAGNSKYDASLSIAYQGGYLYTANGSTVFQYFKIH